jgi:hypothetical protein
MNTYKQFFQYTAVCGLCGIQNVHFGGTLEDWKRVQVKTEALVDYDVNGKLKSFIKNVTTILAKFIDTYQGNVDLDFWNKVVHREGSGGSGMRGPFFSGWLVHLFGYEEKTDRVQIEEIDVPIKIDNRFRKTVTDVKLIGGFRAVSREGHCFRPQLSMAIVEEKKVMKKRK